MPAAGMENMDDNANQMPIGPLIIVMGITAAGKTTTAKALANLLGWPKIEADDYHDVLAVAKMARGEPLTDEDRWPWLARLKARADLDRGHGDGRGLVMECSALKRAYREILKPDILVYLDVDQQMGEARAKARENHFAKANLIASQLATLEPPSHDEGLLLVASQLNKNDARISALAEGLSDVPAHVAMNIAPVLLAVQDCLAQHYPTAPIDA